MYSNLLEHVKEYSDFYFPFLFGLIFPITISKIYRCNRKSEVNSSECQDSFFQEMKWSILSLSVYILAWIWKWKYYVLQEVQKLMKTSTNENSTTLNTSESANINKKSKNLWKLPGQLEYRYLKLQILIRSQKKLWKLHNIEYILEQLWWMRVQQF